MASGIKGAETEERVGNTLYASWVEGGKSGSLLEHVRVREPAGKQRHGFLADRMSVKSDRWIVPEPAFTNSFCIPDLARGEWLKARHLCLLTSTWFIDPPPVLDRAFEAPSDGQGCLALLLFRKHVTTACGSCCPRCFGRVTPGYFQGSGGTNRTNATMRR